jgi:hypothetical protein
MKTYRFTIDFGDDSWTVNHTGWQGAAIIASAERIKNGLHNHIYFVRGEKGTILAENVVVCAVEVKK